MHVAEYLGVTIDERQQRTIDERNRVRLATIEPYPRFSVSTRRSRREPRPFNK